MAEASIRHPRSNVLERVVQRTHIAFRHRSRGTGAVNAEESTVHVIPADECYRPLGPHEIGQLGVNASFPAMPGLAALTRPVVDAVDG